MMLFGVRLTLLFLICSILGSLGAYCCPCFHRYYLYAMFYSDEDGARDAINCNDKLVEEEITDSQIVSLTTQFYDKKRNISSSGSARSDRSSCGLLVEDQVIAAKYTKMNDRRSCDREIIEACKALKSNHGWPKSKAVPYSIK